MWLLALTACVSTQTLEVGDFDIKLNRRDGSFTVVPHDLPGILEDVRLVAGDGSADVEMRLGSFRFDNVTRNLQEVHRFGRAKGSGIAIAEARNSSGDPIGTVTFTAPAKRSLRIDWGSRAETNRIGFSARCTPDDHFLGLGLHAQDVDHVGEAFPVWVSEQGIGKLDTDVPDPNQWMIKGTRHSSYFPMPWTMRPHLGQGLLFETSSRLDVDFCASDPDRFEMVAWDDADATLMLSVHGNELDTLRALTQRTGRLELPPPWVFSPWSDAVRGADRVREVSARLRDFGVPTSVIWSEDWKGAEENVAGYHLSGEWQIDETLYPDAEDLAAELERDGFQWFAYFSPFIFPDTEAWDEAAKEDVILLGVDGKPYTWVGATGKHASMIDLSVPQGRAFFQRRMETVLDIGFDGWMADYAEWLPTDSVPRSGEDPAELHNRWPILWQQTNAEVMAGRDTSWFVRSGWTGTSGLAPVVWAGDQATSFDPGDGFPTVVPLGLGAAASGIPVFTHDIAGYAPLGPPSDKELWFRWAALGAYSPIMRLHHGAEDQANWQFDSDDETTVFYADMATEHMRLFPYRYGLAALAADEGVPMILPVAFVAGNDWARTDAWMLGDALLVAPVLEAGKKNRHVDLPDATRWFDWHTGREVATGVFAAPIDHIPVFAREGSVVPTLNEVPDTLVRGARGLTTLADVDHERTVYVFGEGGRFREADGTTYTVTGTPTAKGQAKIRFASGSVDAGGATLEIEGTRIREYTVVVVP